jgi:hypothetical protein
VTSAGAQHDGLAGNGSVSDPPPVADQVTKGFAAGKREMLKTRVERRELTVRGFTVAADTGAKVESGRFGAIGERPHRGLAKAVKKLGERVTERLSTAANGLDKKSPKVHRQQQGEKAGTEDGSK